MNRGERVPAISLRIENVSDKTVRGYALRHEGKGGAGSSIPIATDKPFVLVNRKLKFRD